MDFKSNAHFGLVMVPPPHAWGRERTRRGRLAVLLMARLLWLASTPVCRPLAALDGALRGMRLYLIDRAPSASNSGRRESSARRGLYTSIKWETRNRKAEPREVRAVFNIQIGRKL